jgi:lipopolysaccharide transport system ATP-binding protein
MAGAPRVLLLDHALALLDGTAQLDSIRQLRRLCRGGAIVVVSSHDLPLLERLCDVVAALDGGRIIEQGDPGLVLAHYRRRMVEQACAAAGAYEVAASSRHGDGRVEVASIEILGQDGSAATAVRSGELITVRLRLCFRAAVDNPVAGILIRTRIGVSVYGTNTELEQVAIGPRRAGDTAVVEFRFRCDLCPQEYTLTAASHDPDGTPHDWLEEAVLFSVVDDRYTAGVANLRAGVRVL